MNYHTFRLTADCISSIIDKTQSLDYEIILIDNGSSVEEAAEFQRLFPHIRYVRAQKNLGFSKANNLGIGYASGEFVVLINSDTVLINDAFTIASEILKDDPRIGVVSGQLQFPDGQVQPVAGVFSTLPRVLKELFRITRLYTGKKRAQYYLGDTWNYDNPVEADWVWGAFFMFRRDDLLKFPDNKLQEDFFMYYEDVQWCYHFKTVVKKKILYSPHPKAIHYMGKSDKSILDYTEKYYTMMLPNEHQWMKMTKGKLYTCFYYFLKSIFYFSLRRKEDIVKGRVFWQYIFRN